MAAPLSKLKDSESKSVAKVLAKPSDPSEKSI